MRVSAILLLALLQAAFSIGAPGVETPINRLCPVLPDEPVDTAIVVMADGKPIGLCCQRCKRLFLADPAKYLAQVVAVDPVAGASPAPSPVPTTPMAASREERSPAVPPVDPGMNASSAQSPAEDLPAVEPAPPAHAEPHGADGIPSAPVASPEAMPHHDHAAHATAMETTTPTGTRLLRLAGAFHPALVHFPIVILLCALGAEILAGFGRKVEGRWAVRWLLRIGAVTTVVAVALGWISAATAGHPGMDTELALHRWGGTAVGALLLLAWGVAEWRDRTIRPRGRLVLALLVLGNLVVPIVGHLGGLLVFGSEAFTW